jgi:hypothetical protein
LSAALRLGLVLQLVELWRAYFIALDVLLAKMGPNIAFKPNSFRYANNMAEKACHVLGCATRVGLT